MLATRRQVNEFLCLTRVANIGQTILFGNRAASSLLALHQLDEQPLLHYR